MKSLKWLGIIALCAACISFVSCGDECDGVMMMGVCVTEKDLEEAGFETIESECSEDKDCKLVENAKKMKCGFLDECKVEECKEGFHLSEDGKKCEQDTLNACGWYGNDCTVGAEDPKCEGGVCKFSSCKKGFIYSENYEGEPLCQSAEEVWGEGVDISACATNDDCKGIEHAINSSCEMEYETNKTICRVECDEGFHGINKNNPDSYYYDSCEVDTSENCDGRNCIEEGYGVKEAQCVSGECVVTSCMDGYVLIKDEENSNQYCEEEGPAHCGANNVNCYDIEGANVVECVSGKCEVMECYYDFILSNNKCVSCIGELEIKSDSGEYKNEDIVCIDGNIRMNNNITKVEMPNLVRFNSMTNYSSKNDDEHVGDHAKLISLGMPKLKNCDYIYLGDTELTELSFPELTEGYIDLQKNGKLQKLNVSKMTDARFSLVENASLATLNLPEEFEKLRQMIIEKNSNLKSIVVKQKKSEGNGEDGYYYDNLDVTVSGNDNLQSIKIMGFGEMAYLYVQENPALTEIEITGTSLFNGEVTIDKNDKLKSITMNDLEKTNYFKMSENPVLDTVSIPKMFDVNTFYISNSAFKKVELPSLAKITSLEIYENDVLESLSFPKLSKVAEIYVARNKVLPCSAICSLKSAHSGERVMIEENKEDKCDVSEYNEKLADMDACK